MQSVLLLILGTGFENRFLMLSWWANLCARAFHRSRVRSWFFYTIRIYERTASVLLGGLSKWVTIIIIIRRYAWKQKKKNLPSSSKWFCFMEVNGFEALTQRVFTLLTTLSSLRWAELAWNTWQLICCDFVSLKPMVIDWERLNLASKRMDFVCWGKKTFKRYKNNFICLVFKSVL